MISLPIYYTKEYKTKPSKTWLVNLNWYRNAYYHEQNEVKQYYNTLIANLDLPNPIEGEYTLDIKVFYKNAASDGHNIANMFEKFVLDALQELSIVKQDNVKYHLGTIWSIGGCDTQNPRVEIEIKPVITENEPNDS